jgi:hypothetical protein
MNDELARRLVEFSVDKRMTGKSPLCVALVITRTAREHGLPLDPSALVTESQGQVSGLGKGNVQTILAEHGIMRVLAEEGGRTSRGSIGKMQVYVAFLNDLSRLGVADLDAIEKWWVDRVRDFFASKPFVLRFDASKSLQSSIRDLLDQAEKRQREASGTKFAGTLIQHLVGAKLELVMGNISHHGASVADEGTGRDADFLVGDTAIHVTTMPSEALIRKCNRNLEGGLRPIIVTTGKGALVASGLADTLGIAERVDVFEVEQFVSGNVHEHGRFKLDGRREYASLLISKYNEIVDEHETDPSLHVAIAS